MLGVTIEDGEYNLVYDERTIVRVTVLLSFTFTLR